MQIYDYPYQNLSLKNIAGERWKDIPGLEGYYMVSNLGRVKRLEREDLYRNGTIHKKPEMIIKPAFKPSKNRFVGDFRLYLGTRLALNRKVYNLSLSRIVYHCFVEPFDLGERGIMILCKDNDGLNLRPDNLIKSTLSDKAQRIVANGRMESPFKKLTGESKRKQRDAILKKVSKTVSQYTREGKWIATYRSTAAAQRSTGVFSTGIGIVASGKQISAGGYIWRWGAKKTIHVDHIKNEQRIIIP